VGDDELPAVLILTDILLSKHFGFYPYLSEVLADGCGVWSIDAATSGYRTGIPDFDDLVARNYTLSSELEDLEALIAALLEGSVSGAASWNRRDLMLAGHGKGAALALHLERRLRTTYSAVRCSLVLLSPPATIVREGWVGDGASARGVRVPCDRGQVELGPGFLDDARHLQATATLEQLMSTTNAPVLAVCGEQDPVFKVREAERLLRAGDSSKHHLVVIEKAGHHFGARHPLGDPPRPVRTVGEVVARFAVDVTG